MSFRIILPKVKISFLKFLIILDSSQNKYLEIVPLQPAMLVEA